MTTSHLSKVFLLYSTFVPNDADLVCYWFERARKQIQKKATQRVGLIATNSIRGGSNRIVLENVKKSGDIFLAWSDREWILDGAAVRVSIVGFDDGNENKKVLDGEDVTIINADLSSTVDVTQSSALSENSALVARGIETGGPFEISQSTAKQLGSLEGQSKIIVPIINGKDVTARRRGMWVIDFLQTPEVAPQTYAQAFESLRSAWDKAINNPAKKRKPKLRDDWWKFRRSGEKLREMTLSLNRYIATPRVAKYRLFVWVWKPTIPDSAIFVFAREDDYFFGVLHSKLHEMWALRMGTWLGKGNDLAIHHQQPANSSQSHSGNPVGHQTPSATPSGFPHKHDQSQPQHQK